MISENEIRLRYGKNAVISRKGSFMLVHLDQPTAEQIRERTEEFNPDTFFFDECPLCQMVKDSGVMVFDESVFDEDDVIDD